MTEFGFVPVVTIIPSIGQAAAVAGVSKRTFMELLGDYGVSVFNYAPDDLAEDVASA